MEKTFVHQDRNFTARLETDEAIEVLEITPAGSDITGYVGPAPERNRRDPDRIFSYSLNTDPPWRATAMTLDEALRECYDAIIEKEAQRTLTAKAVHELKEWLNRQPPTQPRADAAS